MLDIRPGIGIQRVAAEDGLAAVEVTHVVDSQGRVAV